MIRDWLDGSAQALDVIDIILRWRHRVCSIAGLVLGAWALCSTLDAARGLAAFCAVCAAAYLVGWIWESRRAE